MIQTELFPALNRRVTRPEAAQLFAALIESVEAMDFSIDAELRKACRRPGSNVTWQHHQWTAHGTCARCNFTPARIPKPKPIP